MYMHMDYYQGHRQPRFGKDRVWNMKHNIQDSNLLFLALAMDLVRVRLWQPWISAKALDFWMLVLAVRRDARWENVS